MPVTRPGAVDRTSECASRSRLMIYTLVSGHGLVNHAIRSALPSLIPLIPSYSEAQRALLLSAFFPGYIMTQLPGGAATQRWGGKPVSTINLWSNSILFLLTPLAARYAGPVAVAAVFAALGLAQGSYVPSSSVMIKAWLPTGPGRPWALRAMELGQRVGPLIAAWSVPVMAARWGWTSVPKVYGGLSMLFALMWQVGASEGPLLSDKTIHSARPQADAVEWSVFRLAPVQACIWSHFASNNTIAVMSAWSPTYFVNNLHCTPTQAGSLLAIPPLVQNLGNVAVALLENGLVARRVPLLTVRRGMTAVGSSIQAGFLVLFSSARTPLGAAVAYAGITGGHCFRGSGASANYYEVGGRDTAMINAVGNTVANIPGIIAPGLGLLLLQRTGSWLPLFWLTAALQCATGLAFGRLASLSDARTLLAAKRTSRKNGSTKASVSAAMDQL